MSDGQQDLYTDEPVTEQYDASGRVGSSSASPQSHKRKRESIDELDGKDETGREGSSGARRTSLKQTSPNMAVPGSFIPVNTTTAQYGYQPLNMASGSATSVNGSATAEAATAALAAAGAMNSLMPHSQSAGGMGYAEGKPEHTLDNFNALSPPPVEGHTEGVGGGMAQQQQQGSGHQQAAAAAANPKPQVGTEEWHRVRRDNHKEVERRRRETINEGINELAKIVPGCEKNKGSILQRAVQYIQQLKENETQNIEKWTLEKLLTEQAIQELSQNNEKLQRDLDRVNRECETWKKTCLSNGLNRESQS